MVARRVHDKGGDRQISSEGHAYYPALSADGKKVYYLARSEGSTQNVSGRLWIADLESGERAQPLPGISMLHYDVSDEPAGQSPVWMATLDGRSAPRQLTSIEAVHAVFGARGEVVFSGRDSGQTFLYCVGEDGSGLQKVVPDPIGFLYSVSPDGKWIGAWVGGSKKEGLNSVVVYSVDDGTAVRICVACASAGGPTNRGHMPPMVSWSPDQRFLYLAGRQENGTYAVPLRPGEGLPSLPASGLVRFPQDAAALPGARLISSQWVFAGSNPSVYAFTRVSNQRNIYRILLP